MDKVFTPELIQHISALLEAVLLAVCLAVLRIVAAYLKAKIEEAKTQIAKIENDLFRSTLEALVAMAEAEGKRLGLDGEAKMRKVLDAAFQRYGVSVPQDVVEAVLADMKARGAIPRGGEKNGNQGA